MKGNKKEHSYPLSKIVELWPLSIIVEFWAPFFNIPEFLVLSNLVRIPPNLNKFMPDYI